MFYICEIGVKASFLLFSVSVKEALRLFLYYLFVT